jgi:hypothetical protein
MGSVLRKSKMYGNGPEIEKQFAKSAKKVAIPKIGA